MDERLLDIEGQTVRVRSRPGDGAAVVLLHGIPGSSASWSAVIDRLPGRVPLVVPDLVGFGGSGRTEAIDDLHAEGQARRILAAIERLRVERPVVVGHDFGGPVALRMAMRRPGAVGGLILAATNAFADTPVPFPLSLTAKPVIGPMARRLFFSRPALAGMCRFGAKQGRVEASAAVGDRSQARSIARIFGESLRRMPEFYGPIQASLASITVPVTVLWGTDDPFFAREQGRRLADAIPGAQLRQFAGCGHFLPEEDPSGFAGAIAAMVAVM